MYRIAVIGGDGIGPEVCAVALRVLEALDGAEQFEYETFPWGSAHCLSTGRMMPADALETLAGFDAILFGAVGSRELPDHVTLWGLRLAIVQGFDQGVSLRPAQLLPGVRGPLAGRGPEDVDLVVVRENTEGEYSGIGGFTRRGLPGEVAVQTTVYSREAIARTARYAFALARSRDAHHLTSVTKSNASPHASVLWDEVVASVAQEFPDVRWESMLVDAAAARLVLAPQEFDVIVASNLHGDILSDLTGALAGSLGMAPSANLSLDRSRPSMFEPVHGSAFDLVGRGLANPAGMVLSAALMLDDLGLAPSADRVRRAVASVCAAGVLTADVGGSATTAEVADAIVAAL
ncbi:MAG TPA: isocitrate/isopropylmalate family dehydrogenase [Solirubrobacteraceae bacterium]|nr:isocitrate/isopropylmalate family dehydrogenase [Solirubrobacteraceae bacterium]